MSGLLKDWIVLLTANVIQQGFTAVTYLYLARLFKPEQYGKFSVILTAVSIAQIIASLGMSRIVTREIAANPLFAVNIIKKFRFLLSVAAVITGVIITGYLFFFEAITELSLLLIICLLFLINIGWTYFESICFGYSRFQLVGIVGAIFAFAIFAAVIGLIKESSQLMSVILILVVIGVVKLIVLQRFTNTMYKGDETFEGSDFSLMKTSLPLYGTALLSLPIIQMPILFLSQFSGKEEVGYFAAISKFTVPITLIIHNLNTIILPKLAQKYKQDKESFTALTRYLFLVISFGGMVLCFVSGVFSKEMVLLFLSDVYLPAAVPLALQFWITLNMMFHSFIGTVMVSAGKEKLMVKLSVFNAIVIGGVTLAGAFYGALGMSLAMWIGYLIGIIVHLSFFITKVESFFSYRLIAVILFLFLGGTVSSFVIVEMDLFTKIWINVLLVAVVAIGFRYLVPQSKKKELKEIIYMVRNG